MEKAGRSIFGRNLDRIVAYHDLLASTGVEWGLLGPREANRLWERHLLPSGAVSAVIDPDARCLDVGSGAGLPGIPVALARPDLSLVLLEPMLRRSNFLSLAVEELGLGDQVSVVRERAEDHLDVYDVVLSRAVAPLRKLVPWCWPLVSGTGRMVAVKGESVFEEIDGAAVELAGKVIEVRRISVTDDSETITAIISHK